MRSASFAIGLLSIGALGLGGAHAFAGTITGSLSPKSTQLNLSDEGTMDWKAWGQVGHGFGPYVPLQKNIPNQIIGDLSRIGPAPTDWFSGNDDYMQLVMTGGLQDPLTVQNNDFVYTSYDGASSQTIGRGWQFSVPASATPERLKVYVNTFEANGTFTATMSGGGSYTSSAPLFTPIAGDTKHTYGYYTLDFAGAGETLTVSWTLASIQDNVVYPNVGMQAASLTAIPEPTSLSAMAIASSAALLARRRRRRGRGRGRGARASCRA